jgi:lipopolysaccharide transport system permease protein
VSEDQTNKHETLIQANRSWFYIDWKGLFHYRDLLFLLVRRDFLARYKQTILGPTWFILQPLTTTLVFTVVFGRFAKVSTDGIPPSLFYLSGITAWSYFSQCLSSVSSSLTSNAGLFSKVYFPRLIVPLSNIVSNLFSFAIQITTFLSMYIYFKYFTPAGNYLNMTSSVFVLPLLLLQTAAIGLGVGLWISALTVRYRDFQHMVPFLTQIWFYSTPVIYPMSTIPEKWRLVSLLNPMTGIVELYRRAFFGVGYMNPEYMLISATVTLLILLSGLLIFNRVERNFVDTI